MTRSELGRTVGAIQMLLVVVMVSSYPRAACASVPPSIPISHPLSSAQLSPASSLSVLRSGSRSPCISPLVFIFPRLSRLSSHHERTVSSLSKHSGWRVNPGWWFSGDRATRGRETLEREGGLSSPGVS